MTSAYVCGTASLANNCVHGVGVSATVFLEPTCQGACFKQTVIQGENSNILFDLTTKIC